MMIKSKLSASIVCGVFIFGVVSPSSAQVYVQDSPTAGQWLGEARDRLAEGELAESAERLQRVLEEHGRKLLSVVDSRYTEARTVVLSLLRENPALLKTYRELNGPQSLGRLRRAGRDPGKLLQVMDLYVMTDAGLEAGMRLAGVMLESDEADAAMKILQLLDGHPGLSNSRFKGQFAYLKSTAALYVGDQAAYRTARSELQGQPNAKLLSDLDRLVSLFEPTSSESSIDPLQPAPTAMPIASVNEPLWRQGFETTLPSIMGTTRNSGFSGSNSAGQHLYSLPVVSDNVVYVNDGGSIYALDRFSGREWWRYRGVISSLANQNYGWTRYWRTVSVDQYVVTPANDRLVGVVGYASVAPSSYRSTSQPNFLVSLDSTSGEELWRFSVGDVAPDLDSAYFCGRPIVDKGRVYVMVRRRQKTSFHDTYVFAFRLLDGDLVWQKHVASVAQQRHYQSATGLSHMLFDRGALYVDSQMGAVAKLLVTDGTVDWLATNVAVGQTMNYQSPMPWQIGTPVMLESGLVVLDNQFRRIRVIDTQTGATIKVIPTEHWRDPLYLVAAGDDVIAVGTSIVRIDGKTLDKKWLVKLERPVEGRASLAGDDLFVPTGNAVSRIDIREGKLAQSLPISSTGNLLAIDGQIIASHQDAISSYSSWESASKSLERLVDDSKDNGRPLLALAQLAVAAKKYDVVIESFDRAIGMVNSTDSNEWLRAELFKQVLKLVEGENDISTAIRGRLFDRLAAATSGARDEVAYRLAYGRFQAESGRVRDAIEEYHAVLGDPIFRKQLYDHSRGSRQAGLEAQIRLKAMIDEHGRQVYEPSEVWVNERFDYLSRQTDSEGLVELAQAYPLSRVAGKALELAADQFANDGDIERSLETLRDAERVITDPDTRASIWSRQAKLLEKTGRLRATLAVLKRVKAFRPGFVFDHGDETLPVDSWLSRVASVIQQADSAPDFELPIVEAPAIFAGSILPVLRPSSSATHTGHVLTAHPNKVELRKLDADMTMQWRKDADGDEIGLIRMQKDRVWLWSKLTRSIECVDVATGRQVWNCDPIDLQLATIERREPAASRGSVLHQQRGVLNHRARVLQFGGAPVTSNDSDDPILFDFDESAVAFADRTGRVMVVDAADGHTLWKAGTELRQATYLVAKAGRLVVAGNDASDAMMLCIYDLETGQLLRRLMQGSNEKIIWVHISDTGMVLYATQSEIFAYNMFAGQSMWSVKPSKRISNKLLKVNHDRLVALTQEGDLIFVDVARGKVVSLLPIRIDDPVDIHTVDGDWYIVTRSRCIAVNHEGNMIWRDGLHEGSKQVVKSFTTNRYVGLLSGVKGTTQRLYILDRSGGSLVFQADLNSGDPIAAVYVQGRRLILSGMAQTSVLTGMEIEN